MSLWRLTEDVGVFRNKHGTCKQWIKKGKGAMRCTRLLRRPIGANARRLKMHGLAYNLCNLLRTLAASEPGKDWSRTALKENLMEIGSKKVGRTFGCFPEVRDRHSPKSIWRHFAGNLRSAAAGRVDRLVRFHAISSCPSTGEARLDGRRNRWARRDRQRQATRRTPDKPAGRLRLPGRLNAASLVTKTTFVLTMVIHRANVGLRSKIDMDSTKPDRDPEPQGQLTVCVVAMPGDTNANGDIFGGWVLSQMDLACGILARDVAQGRCVTVAIDAMTFIRPVKVGDVLCVYTLLDRIGRTSIRVHVEAWARRFCTPHIEKVTNATFTFVAIDDAGRPTPVRRSTVEGQTHSINLATAKSSL